MNAWRVIPTILVCSLLSAVPACGDDDTRAVDPAPQPDRETVSRTRGWIRVLSNSSVCMQRPGRDAVCWEFDNAVARTLPNSAHASAVAQSAFGLVVQVNGAVSFYPVEQNNLNFTRMFLPNRGAALYQPTALPEIGRPTALGDSVASFYFSEGDVLKELALNPGIMTRTITTEAGLAAYGEGTNSACVGGPTGVRCGLLFAALATSTLSNTTGTTSVEAGTAFSVVRHARGVELIPTPVAATQNSPGRTLLPNTQDNAAFAYNRAADPVVCLSDGRELRCGEARAWNNAQVVRGVSDVFSVSMRGSVVCALNDGGPICLRFNLGNDYNNYTRLAVPAGL